MKRPLLISGLMLLAAPGVYCQCFFPATEYSMTGMAVNNAVGLALGDMNEDGNMDIVSSSTNFPALMLLSGDGLGNFTASVLTYDASDDIKLADLNGDNHLDVVYASNAFNEIGILFGNGAGSFSSVSTFAVSAPAAQLVVADFNEDGDMDVVATVPANDAFVLYIGDGTGNLATPESFIVGDYSSSIAMGDLNGDTNLDVVTGNYSSGNVSVCLGDGTGNFAAAVNFSVPQPNGVYLLDLNNDGNLDIATLGYMTNAIYLLEGDGNGGFGTAAMLSPGAGSDASPNALTTGDFNMDGLLDIAVSNDVSNSISPLLGDGTGNYTAASPIPSNSSSLNRILMHDFNGDTWDDLVLTGGDSVHVFINCYDLGVADQDQFPILVYPNPANGEVTVSGITGKTFLRLFDAAGNCVLAEESEQDIRLNVNALSPGIYLLETEAIDGIRHQKISITG